MPAGAGSPLVPAHPIAVGMQHVAAGDKFGGWTNNGTVLVPAAFAGRGMLSRSFTRASSQYLVAPTKVIGFPLTFFAVAKRDSGSANRALLSIGASTNDRHLLYIDSSSTVSLFTGSAAEGTATATNGTLSDTTEYHTFAGRVAGAASRDVWKDGAKGTENTTSRSPAACNTITVGGYWTSGAIQSGFYWGSEISFAAAWNRALSNTEIEELHEWATYGQLGRLFEPTRAWVMLGAVTSASGVVAVVTKTLGALTSSSAASVRLTATSSQTLGALTLASAAKVAVAGVASGTLGALTAASAAKIAIAGATAKTLGTLTSSGAARPPITVLAEDSVTAPRDLEALTSSSSAKLPLVGTSSTTLGALTLSSSCALASLAGTLSRTLGAATLSSASKVALQGTATATLGALSSSSSARVALAATVSRSLGAVTLSSASTVIGGLAATLSRSLAALTATSSARVSIRGSATATLGAITSASAARLAVAATVAQTLGQLTSSASGTFATMAGSVSRQLGPLTLSATGTIRLAGSLSTSLGPATLTSTARLRVSASLARDLGALRSHAIGVGPQVGRRTYTYGSVRLSPAVLASGARVAPRVSDLRAGVL
jgi:hypothetical protein